MNSRLTAQRTSSQTLILHLHNPLSILRILLRKISPTLSSLRHRVNTLFIRFRAIQIARVEILKSTSRSIIRRHISKERLISTKSLSGRLQTLTNTRTQLQSPLHRLMRNQIHVHLMMNLTHTVHTTRTLNQTNNRPRQVIVHHHVSILKVLTLRQHVSSHQHTQLRTIQSRSLRVRCLLRRHTVRHRRETTSIRSWIISITSHRSHILNAQLLQALSNVVRSVLILREHQHLIIRVLLLNQITQRM